MIANAREKVGAAKPALLAASALAVLAALTSCAGSLFQSKAVAPSVYLLSAAGGSGSTPTAAPASAGVSTVIPVDLAVLLPHIRKGLDSDRIAVLYPDRRLDYFADAKWSGPLDEVMQDLVVEALRSRAHLRNVTADASAFAGGYWLEVDVADFQAEYASAAASAAPTAPTIHVHLLVRVGGAADRRVLGRFDADARQPATDNRLTTIVDAYERAVDAALAQIVDGIVQTLSSRVGS